MAEESEADDVYVLLKKNYRISRNIRLIWFFNNILRDLNKLPKVVSKDGKIDDFNGHEIQILSWSQKADEKSESASKFGEELEHISDEVVPKCTLQPETKVYFLSRGYRLVFALDLSPSAFRIDVESFRTIAEGILSRLADCLCCLVKPFRMPNSDVELHPNIYVTVFSQTKRAHKNMGKYTQDVIVQGCLLTPKSVSSILNAVECKIYHGMKSYSRSSDIESSHSLAKHDHGLVSMLRTGLLALQLLPSNTSAGIVVITDGVVGVPDMAVLETLLNQLRSTTTSCSFLHVRSSQTVFHDYAYCVNIELLKFMSDATYGTFFESSDNENFKADGLNIFQKCLLMWRFQIGDEADKLSLGEFKKSDVRSWEPETDLRYTPKQKNMYISPILRKKHFEQTLRVSIFALLSVRLREGYMIDAMTLGKNQSQLEVKLIYPWNHGVSIKYIASSPWPATKSITKVEVFIEGTYEFLFDVIAGIGHENWSRYRSIVARRFKHFIKGLTQTDHMMTHLQSFNSDAVNYTISQKHIPLFYLPPNSNQLVLSMPDAAKSQFALYWKPVLSLDINIWQKWLHTHHIDIILQHDLPLPKHLHVQSKSNRYHTIQTSAGMSRLTSLLRDWCTFVLLENHSYVKFTYKENEDKPSSFYVVRLSSKAPVVVIRLAFSIGTPGLYRNQILSELRDRVLALTFQSANKPASTTSFRPSGTRSRNPSAQPRSRHVSASERTCAVLIHKPLDRILIRYDQTPKDFLLPPTSGYRHGKNAASTSSRSGHVTGGEVGSTPMMQDLCRYMEHDRCVWSITNRSLTPLSVSVVGQIANLLVKLRLLEGFNFASTSSGVTCMTREFPMTPSDENGYETIPYCLAQFIIFPPTDCTSRESFSLDGSGDDEEDTAEADGELLLATEMWIEPQCGHVNIDFEENGITSMISRQSSGATESSGRLSRFNSVSSTNTATFASSSSHQTRFAGANYKNLPQIIFDEDHFILTILVTIEHLRLMCVPRNCVLSTFPQPNDTKKEKNDGAARSRKASSQSYVEGRNSLSGDDEVMSNAHSAEGITHYPCLFDIVSLLDHCPRVKLLFMTLSQGVSDRLPHPNKCLFDFFHVSLNGIFDREAVLSENDSVNITKHMIKRNNGTIDSQQSSAGESVIHSLKWKCYLKVLPKAKVLVVLLPSTFEDLQIFATVVPGLMEPENDIASTEQEAVKTAESGAAVVLNRNVSRESDGKPTEADLNVTDTSFLGMDHRLSRRRSVKRITSLNLKSSDKNDQIEKDLFNNGRSMGEQVHERLPQISLPVFMYECTTTNLVEQLMNDATLSSQNISNADIEQDYRMKSVDSKVEPESTKHKYFRSHSYPAHHISGLPNARNEGVFTPSPEDVFSPSAILSAQWTLDSESFALCETVVDAFHRCFVRAVANNLRLAEGYNVASVDVQTADALCIESMKEIDITQFLLITCPQVAAFKNQHLLQETDHHDDVFTAEFGEHIPVPTAKSAVRHKSSTSSATDPTLSNVSSQILKINKKYSSESPEQTTRGSKNQVTGLNRQEIEDDDCKVLISKDNSAGVNKEKPVKSAFKKLRKRPQSFPKSMSSGREVSDGDTPESEVHAFFTQSSSVQKIEELVTKDEVNVGSLPRSLKVSKPIQKLHMGARVDWESLPEFPVSLLQENHLRHMSGNDDHIRKNFNDLLSNNFSVVQTMPEIFYYDPKVEAASNAEQDEEGPEKIEKKPVNEMADEFTAESDLDVKFELGGNDTMTEIEMHPENTGPLGMTNQDGGVRTYGRSAERTQMKPKNFDGFDLAGDFDNVSECSSPVVSVSLSDNELYREQQDAPLFLCMTCTIWDKKTGNHGTTVVEGLPTSLLNVISSLERPCDQIDLSQLRITLDLIWITLPPESEEDLTPDLDYQDRFASGLLPDEEDSPRHDSNSTREKLHTLREDAELPDPLSVLPRLCAEAVNSTKKEIEWLLEDEIISALRTCEVVDCSTLQKVTSHIEESEKPTCVVETSTLQFVFGAEKSLQLFHLEFERMFKDFKGYRMKKEGEYYYFTTERTFFPITNWSDETVFQAIDRANENDVLNTQNNRAVKSQNGQSNAESNSSGGKIFQDTTETNVEKTALRRTKTAPNTLRSPSARIYGTTKSCTSLSFTSSVHSNSSFRSLPTNEAMSIDAIESDVAQHGSASNQVSPNQYESLSRVRQRSVKASKHGKSRLSLPNTTVGTVCQDSSDGLLASGSKGKRRLQVKQHSVDSDINTAIKMQQKRHSTHSVMPLSLQNSPHSNTGPTSPLVTGQSSCHNSSFGSASSTPTSRHRSSQNNTPVVHVLQKCSADPSSSTPLVDDWDTNTTTVSSAISNPADLLGTYYKEAMSSPISISDGEYRNSTASGLGSGYDAEGESDVDDFERITSLHDSGNDLPSFWLIVHVSAEHVKTYFHRRSSAVVTEDVDAEHKEIFSIVIDHVLATCKRVNQILLLNETHDSRMCSALLVEETEDDIWKNEYSGQSEDIGDNPDGLLAAAMTTAPGQFACDCVLEKEISLHPRLRMGGTAGKSSVIPTVQDLVINLMITNRKNMFVYRLLDKSVFYCRMEEDFEQVKGDSRRSSQLLTTTTVENSDFTDRRTSRESLSSVGVMEQKSSDTLTLRWHGVGPLFPHQEEELEKMNQSIIRRLDDSILEEIAVILKRNSKLTSADVQFIQPTFEVQAASGSPHVTRTRNVVPGITLSYGLPNEFIGCISAVNYYLHQNLLQFMAIPRYVDITQTSAQFVAYKIGFSHDHGLRPAQSLSGHDGSVFLFHQSIKRGTTGSGIACVALEITDVDGNSVASDSTLKFDFQKQFNLEDLLNLTEVVDFQKVMTNVGGSRSNTPAMTEQQLQTISTKDASFVKTYVRFHLWSKGSLTVDHLNKQLRPAVRHSLFDAITEMLVLRAPLCDLHVHIKQEKDLGTPTEPHDHKQTTSGKTDAMRSIFGSLNDPSSSSGSRGILSNLLHPKLENNFKEDQSPRQTIGNKKGNSPYMMSRRKSASTQAEEGEIGNLRDIYKDLSKVWIDAMVDNECPSSFKFTIDLSTMSRINNLLHDMQKIISTITTDCEVRMFICSHGSEKMVAFNLEQAEMKKADVPGKYPSYIIVARNFVLWRKSGQHPKTAKFQPYDSTMKPEQSPRLQEHRLISPYAVYIPRQQFVIASIQSRSVNVRGYNLSSEIARNLQVALTHCVDFHNARRRALDCITMQKLSLFRHCMFETGFSASSDDKKNGAQTNSYLQDVKDVDLVLTNSKLPSSANKIQSKRRLKSNKKSSFNDAYLSNVPVRPLNACDYNKDEDVATKYANQYLEMKNNLRKKNEELSILHRVSNYWRERLSATQNLSKDVLQVILQNSRVIYHVTSPILFNQKWRRRVLKLRTRNDKPDDNTTEEVKETRITKRQKRLSGAMRKSGDFTGKSYEDAKARSRSNSTRTQNAKDKGSKSDLVQLASQSLEETRYEREELQRALMLHYVRYWQSMHFILVKEEKMSRTEKYFKESTSEKDGGKEKNLKAPIKTEEVKAEKDETSRSFYLYQVFPGGIVIVDISCVEMNFLVKLHVIEASRLPHQQNVNQQMSVLFLNECERLKDYTHVHSFTFDFHLRYLQMYIQDRQTAIRPGYHIVSLLQDFVSYYKKSPACAFNQIYCGTIEAPCSHVLAEELYEYIVGRQSSHHGFKTLKLIDDNSPKTQHALVSSHLKCGRIHSLSCNKEEHDMYDVGYVIGHDSSEGKQIKLNFFVLFTNRRHLFPRFDRPDNASSSVFPIRRGSSVSTPRSTPVNPQKTTTVFKHQGLSPTSQSTSSLHQLTDQATKPDKVAKAQTKHLSPLTTRKANMTSVRNASKNEGVVSQPLSPETVFNSPPPTSMAKRILGSQGRRQSMPNVGHNLPNGSRKRLPEMQGSFGHDVTQVLTESHDQYGKGMPLFVQCEIARLTGFLTNVCASAEIQCYRNQLWNKVYMDKPSQNRTSVLPVEDFEHLLQHCQKVSLDKLNPQGSVLCDVETMSIQWAISLQKRMMARFDQIYRFFTNADSTKRYLGILNPKLYYMMFLITVDTAKESIGMYVVLRDKQAELDKEEPNLANTTENPNLIPLCGHLNNMIDFICYHTWSSLLST